MLRFWEAPFTSSSSLKILSPFWALSTKLYEKGLKHSQRMALLRKQRLSVPVISVGNLIVGGTGKTPLIQWLARYLTLHGRRTAILSRGYGRKNRNTARVPLQGDTRSQVSDFGDEPVLMSRSLPQVPVWVGQKRGSAGQEALKSCGSEVLLLDDGFQHLSLHRDLDLVLLDAFRPFGNGLLLPWGPLREPVSHLDRADAILLTRAEDERKVREVRALIAELFPQKPVFSCRHRLRGFRWGLTGPCFSPEVLQEQRMVAFAGIAQPESFFRSLRESGFRLSHCFAFPDHHFYTRNEMTQLLKKVRKSRARFLITTEKDWVRLPAEMREIVFSTELELDFGSEYENFCNYLKKQLDLVF